MKVKSSRTELATEAWMCSRSWLLWENCDFIGRDNPYIQIIPGKKSIHSSHATLSTNILFLHITAYKIKYEKDMEWVKSMGIYRWFCWLWRNVEKYSPDVSRDEGVPMCVWWWKPTDECRGWYHHIIVKGYQQYRQYLRERNCSTDI